MSEENKNNQIGSEENKDRITYLSGMYQNWFLDYASYVILERAVPYVNDGLKPVQRRILHAMREMDDGRFNKVANIIGQTMQYHPHGDASIGDALVQLGQKDLLVETQGNWGNILTGDSAAAPRYIEARLSKFALDVVFNPKTTNWQLSYDGRNREPLTLPVKFPLLLAQGVEGIAVGLASKILPHNFNELIDAAIAYLKNKEFEIYPDFPTGGLADFSKYNDGLRGGAVKIRARIEKLDSKTLVINELPFSKTTTSLIDSIIKANDRGKIKIKRIDDNTSDSVEILVHLANGISSDKTIDALYAFTDCEVSISPNACIIENDKPHFIGVTEILKKSVDQTVALLLQELQIRKDELLQALHFASLEKIFIENRIYKDVEFEQSGSMDEAVLHVGKRLDEWKELFVREVTRDDILKLMEIRMARILKFNTDKANAFIESTKGEIEEVEYHIREIIPYTIAYFERIQRKYGKGKERKTEIRSFENIVATKVVVANEKLYIDREEGFMGTALKKAEYVCDCSDIDDIIVFRKDGTYFVTKVTDKAFIGKNVIYLAVFKKNDKRTIYNVVYRDGRKGTFYMKRFAVTGVTRDKEYDLTAGTEGSRIWYFSANPNGEAEVLKVTLKPRARMKRLMFEQDLGELAIKGRSARGNILTKYDVHRIVLKEKGISTLGGRKIWFDPDVYRLNSDGRGRFIGEFQGDDQILVIYKNGELELYNFDLSNHFDPDILLMEKYNPDKVLTVTFFDSDQGYNYVKRFKVEESQGKRIRIIGEGDDNYLIAISWWLHPRLKLTFAGKHAEREDEEIDVAEFIGIKSYKARGKRVTTYELGTLEFIDPIVKEESELPPKDDEIEDNDEDEESDGDRGEDEDDSGNPDKDENDDKNQMSLF